MRAENINQFRVEYLMFGGRGNHEDHDMNVDHGFQFDCLHRFVSPSRDARHAKIDRRHGQHVYAAFQVPGGRMQSA
jgi:hypothetical protein